MKKQIWITDDTIKTRVGGEKETVLNGCPWKIRGELVRSEERRKWAINILNEQLRGPVGMTLISGGLVWHSTLRKCLRDMTRNTSETLNVLIGCPF